MATSLDSLLKKVLSIGNKEQNAMYPPRIYEQHVNIATNFIIDEVVKNFAQNRSIVDIASPFLKTEELPVVSGKVKLPSEYRNMLGVGTYVSIVGDKDCGCKEEIAFKDDPLKKSAEQVAKIIDRNKCISRNLEELDIDEFNHRSVHPYKAPTMKDPIFCQFEPRVIKVCPFDISHVEVRYIRRPKEYVYKYTEQPDHTYLFDKDGSTDLEWDDTAIQYLVKAVTALYSVYTRDGEVQNWNEVVKKVGLF
jgi:hypothetical protein